MKGGQAISSYGYGPSRGGEALSGVLIADFGLGHRELVGQPEGWGFGRRMLFPLLLYFSSHGGPLFFIFCLLNLGVGFGTKTTIYVSPKPAEPQ